ncbi:hydantoinase/oxoprolinase family protein [Rouxiella badensis]|jgi:N-methylhydantoinase A|uniref:hydantoinase/oxoprolinase family protein n=1 Tax=Rouxiella badensis TaxID=1646377 RepID=UPI0004763A41|nr:hydantoinase/oxoprolinase family protein [Rouxiella badensis]MCC3701823.1 hydantoinase/oxoprolinase family protein [Rouxiella badensis]MCC3719989.1 hydantoinase/oxoprolinase family protein [Rouxiella badensis]MCC3729652.1 hydantoinase/oxoprolinase family protein [Rouxiella badensis]MCC3731465.1 hydantoinase/oxoprolinase family protein [Rouxiella badensis]MCC3738400.1 hydantoinase/oxoprolinase family protein [Rouxiella badensis]
MKHTSTWRMGFDIGGTFTDLVLLNDETGVALRHKTLTTPHDPSEGAYTGLTQLVEMAGLEASEIQTITHGTTLAINALLERRGAKTAFVVTQGFRDVLVLGREYRYDIYDLNGAPAAPLIPRSQAYEINERLTSKGDVVTPLDEQEVVTLAAKLRDEGYEAVAVLCMHAYAWPEHENRIEAILSRELPGVSISVSHKVSREIREYDRGVLTAMNAFVQPKARNYMARLEQKLRDGGFICDWLVMGSNGGLMAPQVAADFPTRIIESGPAGGIVATAAFARKNGHSQVLAFDMGGTTAKACVVRNGEPSITTDYEVGRADRLLKGSGLPVKLPVVDMIEIGAGGGSIARVDSLGLLEIGPESASAYPGPACYGRGGELPTVTDANLVLGLLDPDAFLGGRMTLDVAAARKAISRIAEPLGLSIEDAAWGIHEVANSKMAEALRTHSVEKNVSPHQMTMLAFGGAGPSHAWSLAKILSVKKVYFPNGAGVYSAFGLLTAPPSADFVRSDRCRLQPGIDMAAVHRTFAEGFDEAFTTLAAANVEPATASTQKLADVRYVGQGSELTVSLPGSFIEQGDVDALIAAFEDAHFARFGRTLKGQGVEVVNWRGRVQTTPPQMNTSDKQAQPDEGAQEKTLAVYLGRDEGFSDCRVVPRSLMVTHAWIDGPALLQEKECAIYVGPGASAMLDEQGNILMELK